MNLKAFDRIITTDEIDLIRRALIYAEAEIHNPGAARSENFDLLDLLDQAKNIVVRISH